MPQKIPLKESVIYGPVDSRRLGKSLGINLSPRDTKSCNFDCVYCQYGSTEDKVMLYDRGKIPVVEGIKEALIDNLKGKEDPDYITFSGNGEPTLHPVFREIAEEVKELRDSYSSDSDIAVLSNASRLMDRNIKETLDSKLIDLPVMKLDAGTQEKFLEVNQPFIGYQDVLKGLERLENYVIQSIRFKGEINNFDEDIEEWIEVVEDLEPDKVHLYSLDRPTEMDLEEVDRKDLHEVERKLEEKGIKTEVF